MHRKTIKRRRNITKKSYKKRANIRRKKQQTKRVKNSRRKRGGAATATASESPTWSSWATNLGQTYAPGFTQQVATTAKGTAIAQQAVQTLGENAETIDQLQTAFLALQRQVDNKFQKFKRTKEEDLRTKFQKECNGDDICVVEKQAEFFAKEQAEIQRRTAANDAFWATLIETDPELSEYTGLTNIQLFTTIVDNWEEIETQPALISAVKSYYNCPGQNTKEALLDCFKTKANEVFANAVDQFESKLRSYIEANLTGAAAVKANTGITMASNALKTSPAYAKTAFSAAKDLYNSSSIPKTREDMQTLADKSRTGIESGFKTLTDNVHQDYHAPIKNMQKFLLELHDVASKLAGLQEEVNEIEDEFADANEGP